MQTVNYPVELCQPDIEPYRVGNTGVDYVTTLDSGRTGPHLMISAVVHGNELCGAIALDWLHRLKLRPRRGKLTLAFANVAAYRNFYPRAPFASRYVDEDLNRVWAETVLDGERSSVELKRARALRPLLDQVDVLLDIHSMQHATVPLMMCGPHAKGRQLALALGYPQHIVSDSGHAAGKRMRDYGPFGDPHSPKNALLVECGQHWQRSSAEVAKQTALRFLAHFELIDPGLLATHLVPCASAGPPRVVEVTGPVTIKHDNFRFASDYIGMEVIDRAGTVIGWDGEREVRTPYDECVLVMPSMRLQKGQTAVRLGRFTDSV